MILTRREIRERVCTHLCGGCRGGSLRSRPLDATGGRDDAVEKHRVTRERCLQSRCCSCCCCSDFQEELRGAAPFTSFRFNSFISVIPSPRPPIANQEGLLYFVCLSLPLSRNRRSRSFLSKEAAAKKRSLPRSPSPHPRPKSRRENSVRGRHGSHPTLSANTAKV